MSSQEGFGVVDVRIFDRNAQRHENNTLKRCYKLNKHEKNRDYNSKILTDEQGSFTPIVSLITGGSEENARCLSNDCVR